MDTKQIVINYGFVCMDQHLLHLCICNIQTKLDVYAAMNAYNYQHLWICSNISILLLLY